MSETPRLYDQPLLAIDLEMTGLDPKRDHILSIGTVPLTAEGIPLGHAQHWLLQTSARVSNSATIHHLRDHDLKVGGEPDEILQNLLVMLQEHVLITHGGELDSRFLAHRHRYYFGKKWRPERLDTQTFARRQLSRRSEQMPTAKTLNLRACRERYHLPNWRAHHALSDAIATAELFQAQLHDAFPKDYNPPWRDAQKSFTSFWTRWGWGY